MLFGEFLESLSFWAFELLLLLTVKCRHVHEGGLSLFQLLLDLLVVAEGAAHLFKLHVQALVLISQLAHFSLQLCNLS